MANELYHYGIEGMKWGVRRYQNADGSYTAAGAARYGRKSSPEALAKKAKKKQIRTDRLKAVEDRSLLSDEELDKRIRRLAKEKQLKDLTDVEVYSGKRVANGVLSKLGSEVVTKAAIGGIAFAGGMIVKNLLGEEAAHFMFPNPNKKK